MWLANELRGNPANKLEAGVLAKNDSENDSACENSIEKYTVKVGDVCFVAIGQIVGRQYQAVRYQPTACIVINSPTEDPKLRQQIRAIWSSNDPATKLFDSLLLDYSTHLQISAAMRLLYYFPRETASLIADRLKKLNVGRSSQHGSGSPATDSELESYIRREAANGGGTSDFIKAVSWSASRPFARQFAIFSAEQPTSISCWPHCHPARSSTANWCAIDCRNFSTGFRLRTLARMATDTTCSSRSRSISAKMLRRCSTAI